MALSTMTASDVEDLRSKLSRLELRAMDELRTEAVRMIGAHMTAAFQITDTDVAFRLKSTEGHEKNLEEAEWKRRKTAEVEEEKEAEEAEKNAEEEKEAELESDSGPESLPELVSSD